MAPTLPVLNPTKSLVSIPGSGYDRKSSPICLNLGFHRYFLPGGPLESSYAAHSPNLLRRRTLQPRSPTEVNRLHSYLSTQQPVVPIKKRKADSILESSSKRVAKVEKDKPSDREDKQNDKEEPCSDESEPKGNVKDSSSKENNSNEDEAAEAKRFVELKNLLEQRAMLRRINKELTSQFKDLQELMQSKEKLEMHLKFLEEKNR